MKAFALTCYFLAAFGLTIHPALAQSWPLKLTPSEGQEALVKTSGREHEISPGARVRLTPASDVPSDSLVLEFEFFCIGGAPNVNYLPANLAAEAKATKLPAIDHSEGWSPYSAGIEGGITRSGIMMSFGLEKDRVLLIRNTRVRTAVPGEFDVKDRPRRSLPEDVVLAELQRTYPAAVTKVTLLRSEVEISGRLPEGTGSVVLAEIPIDRLLTDPDSHLAFHPVTRSADGNFAISLPRMSERSGLPYDRLLSRWRLVTRNGEEIVPISHARYAEDVECIRPHPPIKESAHKKALSAYSAGVRDGELETLGIAAIKMNILMDRVLAKGPGRGTISFEWQGRTYHAHLGELEKLDRTALEAVEKDQLLSAVLLVANPTRRDAAAESLLAHPDAVPQGIFAMPDVVSEEGMAAFSGLIDFMAERWSRADGKYGRIHHWVIQNEVDAGWVWTNVGEIKAAPFMDLYQRSARITDLIIRQYDPNARALISLTHHWTERGNVRFYGSKRMFELLLDFTRTEGDFPWMVAYHPYPEDLRNPRAWQDKLAEPHFNTPKITPRNIEVLDAWMHRDELRYRGEVRFVQLSENGFNSPKNNPKGLEEQAAGMAYVWKKIKPLQSITTWHYHNWHDNPAEGGLLLGLRGFKSEGAKPKPIWYLYRDLNTSREDEACAPYLKTIGIESWDEVLLDPADIKDTSAQAPARVQSREKLSS